MRIRMINNAPCQGCKERHENCHSVCQGYIEWRDERTKLIDDEYERQGKLSKTYTKAQQDASISKRNWR